MVIDAKMYGLRGTFSGMDGVKSALDLTGISMGKAINLARKRRE